MYKIASCSPDGRKMITVGDDNRVQLFNVTNSGHYELSSTMAGKKKKKSLKCHTI
jgi:hypothetical protein